MFYFISRYSRYLVLLIIILSCRKNSNVVDPEPEEVVPKTPEVDFSYELQENGKVKFTNHSKHVEGFDWEFGDFTFNGKSKDTTHHYIENGSYVVKLKAVSEKGDTLAKEKKIEIVNRVLSDDGDQYLCGDNSLSVQTDSLHFCTTRSEYGVVLLKKNKSGREFAFWNTFVKENSSAAYRADYAVHFVCNIVINDIGTYESTINPENRNGLSPNTAFIRTDMYPFTPQPPVKVEYFKVKKIIVKITNVSEKSISGNTTFFLENGSKYTGRFRNMEVRTL